MIRSQFFTISCEHPKKAGQKSFQFQSLNIFSIIKNDFRAHIKETLWSERHERKYLARRIFDSQVGRIVIAIRIYIMANICSDALRPLENYVTFRPSCLCILLEHFMQMIIFCVSQSKGQKLGHLLRIVI